MDGQKLSSRTSISTSQSTDTIHVVRNGVSYKQEARFFKPETLQNDVVGAVNFIGGMDYFVWASQYTIDSVVYNNYVSGIVTLDDGGANNRFDRFVVEVNTIANPTTASIVVVKGTEAISPVLPSIDAENQIEISFVLVAAGQTDNDGVITSLIYDENTGEPNEWDNTSLPTGGNLDYTIDPFRGTKSYRGDAIASGVLAWTANETYTFDSTSKLSFAYKGQLTETSKVSIKLINSSDGSYWLNTILLSNINDYGYNNIAAGWQVLDIKLSEFTNSNVDNNIFDRLEFKFVDTPVIELDRVNIQSRLQGDLQGDLSNGFIRNTSDYSLQNGITEKVILMEGDNLTLTIPTGYLIEDGDALDVIAKGTGFTLNSFEGVVINKPENFTDLENSIFKITKTNINEYNVIQLGQIGTGGGSSLWTESAEANRIFTTDRVAIGNNSATGGDYLVVGNAKNGSTEDAKVLINHDYTGASGNSHGFTDGSHWDQTDGAAFNSFQSAVEINTDLDHYNAFQSEPSINGARTGLIRGFRSSIIGSGSIDEYRAIDVFVPVATINNIAYGLYVNNFRTINEDSRPIRTFGGIVEFGNNGYTGDVDAIWLSRNDITTNEKQSISFRVGSSNVEASAIGNEWKGSGAGELFFKTTQSSVSTERMRIKSNGVVNMPSLPTFANDLAAASLSTGDLYKTSTGELRIKL